ncbi:MAG: serine/threonine protein kinase [Opitutae bacterium]|nr:serine/threonine protein kinase [Opitutae bacterium]
MPVSAQLCPHCHRSTATPFGTTGLCLLCAGQRALALDLEEGDPLPAPAASGISHSPFGGELPDRIGPYDIIDEIARGGMGRVFAARQPRLDRVVALKVLVETAGTLDLAQRFLREAQTVARLRHPHIVTLHDSGRADGFAYFAMDYLEGGDLGRRLRNGPLAPRAAAALAQKIAAALAYAHAEGVLHRDIKPSNILLDGDEPLLADFGLAAQLEPGGDLTAVSTVLGTPHYLAPEALHGGSAALGIASDLYALGVVLYEMLAGRTPFAGATAAELPALLDHSEAPPLRLLAPATPRDLVVICLKCLERDPARRYADAAALAEDLRRFLAGEPILARAPGALAQFRRFARRHRTMLAVAAGTGAALTVGIVTSTVLAVRARQAERRASTEAATARALLEFFQRDILLQSKPGAQADRDLKLRTALDTAAARIGGRFAQEPAAESALRATLGEALLSLGEYAKAAEQFSAAVRLRRQLGLDAADTWRLVTAHASALAANAQLVEAERLLTPNVAALRRALGADDLATLAAEQTLARVWVGQDKLAQGLQLRRSLLSRRTHLQGPEHPDTLTAANEVATALLDQGQFPEARDILTRTAEARKRVLGPEAPETIESLNDLAGANWALGRLPEAEARFREVVTVARRVLGPNHPDTLRTLGNLGHVLSAQARWDEAAGVFEEAYAQTRAVHGEGHQDVLRMGGALAAVYLEEGYFDKAEAMCREIIEPTARRIGAMHPEVLASRTQLGGILVAAQKYAEAETELRATLAAHREVDERRPLPFIAESHLGAALTGLGRLAEAEEHLLSADRGLESLAGQLTPRQMAVRRLTLVRLATLYRATGRSELADGVERRLKQLGAAH